MPNNDSPMLEELFNWGGVDKDGVAYDGWSNEEAPPSGEKSLPGDPPSPPKKTTPPIIPPSPFRRRKTP